MTFKVFHYTGHLKLFSERAYREEWPSGYVEVATVEATELGEVFQLTNNIDGAWVENEGVTPSEVARDGARSTSVGDVFTRIDALGYERAYGVAGSGFEEITNIALSPADWGLKEVAK